MEPRQWFGLLCKQVISPLLCWMQIYCTVRHWTKGRCSHQTKTAFLRLSVRSVSRLTWRHLTSYCTHPITFAPLQSHQVRTRLLMWQKWSERQKFPCWACRMVANKRNWSVRGFNKAKVPDWCWNPIKSKSAEREFWIFFVVCNPQSGGFHAYLPTVKTLVVNISIIQDCKTVTLWRQAT